MWVVFGWYLCSIAPFAAQGINRTPKFVSINYIQVVSHTTRVINKLRRFVEFSSLLAKYDEKRQQLFPGRDL